MNNSLLHMTKPPTPLLKGEFDGRFSAFSLQCSTLKVTIPPTPFHPKGGEDEKKMKKMKKIKEK